MGLAAMNKHIHSRTSRCMYLLLLTLSLTACGGGGGGGGSSAPSAVGTSSYEYQPPVLTADGWMTAHAEEMSVDPASWETLIDEIRANRPGFRHMDGLAIVKGNRLLLDERFKDELDFTDEWADNRNINLHILNSVTKSFTSAMVGIAIDQGYIPSTDVKVLDYFQTKNLSNNWDDRKAEVTLKNWLTMRHGLDWNEWDVSYFEDSNQNSQMNAAGDPIQFLMDVPLVSDPGTVFAYSTGVSYAIGRILEVATGERPQDFLARTLFEPLEIRHFRFWAVQGRLHTGSSLYLSTRDMAKFGQLFLDGGVWQGQRVISHAWVEESTRLHVDRGGWGYGYHWWVDFYSAGGQILQTFYADGLGGQHIFVFPAIDAVVVVTGSAYEQHELDQRDLTRMLQQYVLPPLVNAGEAQ